MSQKGRFKGMKFRTREEMRLAVLKSLSKKPLLQSHVTRDANLMNKTTIELLDELIEEGLVAKKASRYRQGKTTIPVRTIFFLTPKGIEELFV